MERLKIRTKKKRIITLDVSKRTDTEIHGTDLFGDFTIVYIDDIESVFTLHGDTDDN